MRFASYDWIYGRAQPFPFSCGARYPWGEITLELQVEEGVCRDAAVYTDSMDAKFAAPLAEALARLPLPRGGPLRPRARGTRLLSDRGRPVRPARRAGNLKGVPMADYQLIVIGAGPGGYTAARAPRSLACIRLLLRTASAAAPA